jgi:hypothetical protein
VDGDDDREWLLDLLKDNRQHDGSRVEVSICYMYVGMVIADKFVGRNRLTPSLPSSVQILG